MCANPDYSTRKEMTTALRIFSNIGYFSFMSFLVSMIAFLMFFRFYIQAAYYTVIIIQRAVL